MHDIRGFGGGRRIAALATLAVLVLWACTNAPAPSPPDPRQLAGFVWRFYHDVAGENANAPAELASFLSHPFLRAHASTWMRDYGFISSPKVTMLEVRGNRIDYNVEYDYVGTGQSKLHWRRSGTWTAVHGSWGWELNEDIWRAHIVAVTSASGTRYLVKRDRILADGRHILDVPGFEVTFIPPKEKGWRTIVVPKSSKP